MILVWTNRTRLFWIRLLVSDTWTTCWKQALTCDVATVCRQDDSLTASCQDRSVAKKCKPSMFSPIMSVTFNFPSLARTCLLTASSKECKVFSFFWMQQEDQFQWSCIHISQHINLDMTTRQTGGWHSLLLRPTYFTTTATRELWNSLMLFSSSCWKFLKLKNQRDGISHRYTFYNEK